MRIALLLASLTAMVILSVPGSARDMESRGYWELSSLLRYAEENNLDIRLTQNQYLKQRLEAEMIKSGYLPKVDAYADYYWYFSEVPILIFPDNSFGMTPPAGSNGYYPVNSGLPNNLYAGISLTQRLFDLNMFRMKKGSELFDNIEAAGYELKRAELFHSIAITWYELLQLYEKEKYIDFNSDRLDHYMAIVRRQIKNKMADSLQLIELTIKKSELKISDREYRSGIKRKTNYLKMLAGMPDTMDLVIEPGKMDGFWAFVKKDEPETDNTQQRLLNYNLQAKDLTKRKIRADYSPSLDLRFNLLYNLQGEGFPFVNDNEYSSNISSLGVRLDIPLYHGSEKRRKLEVVDVEKAMLDMQKEKLKEGIMLQIGNVEEELKFKREQFLNQKELISLKERQLSKSALRFEKGVMNIKELLEIHSELMDEQMKLEDLYYEVKISELNYLDLTGQLDLLLDDAFKQTGSH